MSESGIDRDKFHVCVTCGILKHEELFRIGACTCDDCKNEGNESVNWREAPDGTGFVSAQTGGEK